MFYSLGDMNFLAIIVAAVAHFVIGGIWYAPKVFGNAWLKEMSLNPATMDKSGMGVTFLGSYVCAVIAAFILTVFIKATNANSFLLGMDIGLLCGIGFVATTIMTNYLYEKRSMRLFLITIGYHIVGFVAMGGILAAWQ